MDADDVAELILQDALDETIDDISRLDEHVVWEAARMTDAPSLETMLQRLQDMEVRNDSVKKILLVFYLILVLYLSYVT